MYKIMLLVITPFTKCHNVLLYIAPLRYLHSVGFSLIIFNACDSVVFLFCSCWGLFRNVWFGLCSI